MSYQIFQEDPKRWWTERLTSPSLLGDMEKVIPNPGHYALAELEGLGVLKCAITQNVDALHEKAGVKKVLEYHGNLLKLRCTSCNLRFTRDEFDLAKLMREDQLPPHCPECRGVIKSDSISFGEPIPSDVAHQSLEETRKCDVILICGTSAVVYPFANLPRIARERKVETERQTETGVDAVDKIPAVIIVEVNAELTPLTQEGVSDYLIQGKTGEILPRIVEAVKRIR